MVSESDIAEARRKALRNGEEDPVAVAQRYLNVYRQMHIFSAEKKESFDQSLLNLSPLTIGIISSLPGGLTFQDYIDEILAKAGRAKSARENPDDNEVPAPQNSILSNAQANINPQQIIAPVVSGPAKISLDKEFAGEFAKIIGEVVTNQSSLQSDSLAKIAQDIGKTQLFIAKKLDDNKNQYQTGINEICKIIAQSHTALSTSLAGIGQNLSNQITQNSLIAKSLTEQKQEDNIRLAKIIMQSQEQIMSGLLSRLPQAVGVGNVNVNTPSRSIEDDMRLAEMISQSQEKMLSKLIENISQTRSDENENKNSSNVENIIALMSQSQEKLISTLTEKLPQIIEAKVPQVTTPVNSNRTIEDDERLVSMIAQSQEKIIAALTEKLPQIIETKSSQANFSSNTNRTIEDDERLVSMITKSQENMIKSLIEQNILSPQLYQTVEPPIRQTYFEDEQPHNSLVQNIDDHRADDAVFDMLTPVDDADNYLQDQNNADSQNDDYIYENSDLRETYYQPEQSVIETAPAVKKKKKKKKKKKNDAANENVSEEVSFSNATEEVSSEFNFANLEAEYENKTFEDNSDNNYIESNTDNYEILPVNEETDFEYPLDEIKNTEIDFTEDNFSDITAPDNDEYDLNSKIEETSADVDEFSLSDTKTEWGFDVADDSTIIDENKTSWNFDDEDDSWNSDENKASWGFNDYNEDNSKPLDNAWEYAEVSDNAGTEDDGWEYVEVSDDTGTEDDGWEYVEAIDDNAKIYSSDSFSQKPVSAEKISKNNRAKIFLTNIPQIHNEANDDSIDDPYKNSILKD